MRPHSHCPASDTVLYSYHKVPEKWVEGFYIITSLSGFRDGIYSLWPKQSIIEEMSLFYAEGDRKLVNPIKRIFANLRSSPTTTHSEIGLEGNDY